MDEEDDYLTCGKCMTEFRLDKITNFIKHKKQECNEATQKSGLQAELLCSSCPQGFMTAVGLLKHAQTIHKFKLFLERSTDVTGIRGVRVSTEEEAKETMLESSLFSQHNGTQSDTPVGNEAKIRRKNSLNLEPLGSDMPRIPKCLVPEADISNAQTIKTSSMGNPGQGKPVVNVVTKSGVIFPVMNTQDLSAGVQCLNPLSSNIEVANKEYPPLTRADMTNEMANTLSKNMSEISHLIGIKADKRIDPLTKDLQTNKVPISLPWPETISNDFELNSTDIKSCPVVKTMISNVYQDSSPITAVPKSNVTVLTTDTPTTELPSDVTNLLQRLSEGVPNTNTGSLSSSLLSQMSDSGEQNKGDIMDEDVSNESSQLKCCDSQKCGVTVIPGTHEGLKKCCNAVVPKKRKRHFETKHTSFIRPKFCRKLSSSDLGRPYRSVDKKKSGTIFIDLEPNDDGSLSQKSDISSFNVAASTSVSEIGFEVSGLRRDCKYSSQSRPKGKGSVILQPGAIFSIPFAYSLTTHTDGSLSPLVISKHTFQSENSKSTASTDSTSETSSMQTRTETVQANNRDFSSENSSDISIKTLEDNFNNKLEIDLNQSDQLSGRRRRYPTSRPFKCDQCDSAFNQRIHLKKHMSKHTGVKPFKCQQCNYSTVERSHLKVHIRIHTGEKPFKCTYCEYATAQNSTLKIHLKRHHKPLQGASPKQDS